MSHPIYPLAAVVAADSLKLALCLAAIDTRIGGVLIAGPRGMAKSTLARAMAELLPEGRFVTLPLGAMEERVTGTLDLDAALGQGKVQFLPGLLAHADGGVLYVDEVNLLADHLVDLLLDVSASGINLVERDGISHQHPARFLLIGTMNPDEGELRPQLLDRFGMSVALQGSPIPSDRAEIARRRLAFDADPVGFRSFWAEAQAQLISRCAEARQQLDNIPLDDVALDDIAQRCFDAGVEGMRADIVWLRAARAHAAWRGANRITREDLDAVEEFALQHRRPPAPKPPLKSGSMASGNNAGEKGNQRNRAPDSDLSRSGPGTDPLSKDQNHAAQSDWGALPARPTPTGPTRSLADWTKKGSVLPKKR